MAFDLYFDNRARGITWDAAAGKTAGALGSQLWRQLMLLVCRVVSRVLSHRALLPWVKQRQIQPSQ